MTQHFLVDRILVKQLLAFFKGVAQRKGENISWGIGLQFIDFPVTQCARVYQLEVTVHSAIQPVSH